MVKADRDGRCSGGAADEEMAKTVTIAFGPRRESCAVRKTQLLARGTSLPKPLMAAGTLWLTGVGVVFFRCRPPLSQWA